MRTNDSENTNSGKKEILLHKNGRLIPGKRQFAYHSFPVPPYTKSLQVFLEGQAGGLFLAVFDPDGVRGSGTGKADHNAGLLGLTVRTSTETSRPGVYLPVGTWKVLVDTETLQTETQYAISVWGEQDETAYLYPWLKPGSLIAGEPAVVSTGSVTLEKAT